MGTPMIALLRGINVGGHRKVPMTDLRALTVAAGFERVETYIASGNVLLVARSARVESVEQALEHAIEARFGFAVPVIVRAAKRWATYSDENPFRAAAEARPNLLHLLLSKRTPNADAVTSLRARAGEGEHVELRGDGLWIDFGGGVGRSKLTPTVIDKAVGSSVTARNFKTVLKLAELAARLER